MTTLLTTNDTQLEQELDRFSDEQKRLIYENLFAIELVEGCSMGCDFCGGDSLRGVRSVIPFSTLETIADEMVQLTRKTTSVDWHSFSPKPHLSLYGATEPLDYEYDGKNYFDVQRVFKDKGFDVTASTAIPKGKEELAIAHLNDIFQISISHMNRRRLRPYFDRLGIAVYFDLFNFRVWRGESKFYDFLGNHWIKVDGDVEEAVGKLREQYPYLPKNTRYYNLRRDGNGVRWNVQTGETLFLFCADDLHPSGRRVVDRDFTTVNNIGRAFDWEFNGDVNMGFGDDCGVKIAPTGIYNVLSVMPSQENKTGRIVHKIRPDKFNVVKLNPHHVALCKYEQIESHYAL